MKPLPHDLIKLVFFDLDGTLVNSRGNVSEPVREAVFRLHERGVHVSFASGRPAFGATWLLKDLQIRDLCMFSSSSVIFDPVSQTPVEVSYLDEVILKAFLVAAEGAGLYTELYSADSYFVERESRISQLHAEYLGKSPEIRRIDEMVGRVPIVKVVVVAEGRDEELRMRALLNEFPEFHYGIARGAAHDDILFANGTNPASSREYAFRRITESLGILPGEVLSFGDGESDIPFFNLAGVSVAMGNASEKVKECATFVTSHVDEDGVAVALKALFPHHTNA